MNYQKMKTLLNFALISVTGLAFLLFVGQNTLAQQRGLRIQISNGNGSSREVQLYEGSYALIIGNSEYSNGWNRLSGVKSDVIAVRNILERHGFKVETEENLTSDKFELRIRKFINDYGYDRDNRLIIYYAGHGYTLNSAGDNRQLGYIIPSDTPLPNSDPRGFRQKAINMSTIQNFAREIQSKHALFVFDSCFSGKLFALRNNLKISPFIYDKIDKPVRQFITAGDETQTVPDESVFRKAFVRGLEGDADRNNDNFITGTELAEYLKEVVTNYSNRRQTPQYGLINDIDLDRGDFVFALPLLPVIDSTLKMYVYLRNKRKCRALLKDGNYDELINCSNKLIELNSNLSSGYSLRGLAYYKKGNYDQAIADYTIAINLSPNYAELYKERSTVYEEKGDKVKAEIDRKKVAELEKTVNQ